MAGEASDRLAIRDLIENWALWRDARQWERFRTVWHDDGRMMATWFQGSADEFIRVSREGYDKGVRILHFLGGMSIDLAGDRAIAQTKMTISQRAQVESVLCDVVCTGRFYDFLEKRKGRWGMVLRQPIYEKDRIDPVDPAATLEARQEAAGAISRGLSPPRLSAGAHRLQGEDRHARPRRAAGRGALRARRRLAEGQGALAPETHPARPGCNATAKAATLTPATRLGGMRAVSKTGLWSGHSAWAEAIA